MVSKKHPLFVSVLGAVALSVSTTATVQARYLSSRDQLTALLLPGAVTEGFDRYNSNTGGTQLGVTTLDSTTVANGQGPGLVAPGLSFSAPGGVAWYGDGTAGQLSWTTTSTNALTISFNTPVQAFGFQISSLNNLSMSTVDHSFQIQVYAPGGTSSIDLSLDRTQTTIGIFQGFEEDGGIGRVVISPFGSNSAAYPFLINDLTFGLVPEPHAWAILLLGAGALAGAKGLRGRKPAAS